MKNSKLLIFCLALLPLTMLTVPVAAQTRTVGVHPEDWFKYTITSSLNSPYNAFLWMKVQVTGVSGTTVTGQMTVHYQNGSEITTTTDGWVNVETGDGGSDPSFSLSGFFIAANLGEGDVTYTSQNILTIDSTADRTYPGGARATNHAQNRFPGFVGDYYWDKSTGAMVEMDLNSTSQHMLMHAILVDSGVWVVPEFSPMLLLALFAAFTLVAVVYKRKQLKTPTR